MIDAGTDSDRNSFSDHVREGLTADPKWLPSRFLYDRRGSELFEEITRQPEYYQYRAEREILRIHADEITADLSEEGTIVELGSGNAEKTRILLRSALNRWGRAHFVPVDISRDFLLESARELVDEFEHLNVTTVAGTYRSALKQLPERKAPRLFLFLGGSIGNFEPEESRALLSEIRSVMHPEDRFVMGFDRFKDPEVIEPAYNDGHGVTAEFNKNILKRINRELNGQFKPERFRHEAPFVMDRRRVEMHLVSRESQTVHVEDLDRTFSFEAGESIHTENSYKYRTNEMIDLCETVGLQKESLWQDENNYFCEIRLYPD